jgi:YD repeat-containing protein
MYANMTRQSRKFFAVGICLLTMLLASATSLAIARGYTTDDSGLQVGMVVALSQQTSGDTKVERATQDSSDRVVGIVTTIESSLVATGSNSTTVLIEGEGETEAYVSDINGEVNQGDNLVLSQLKGILMKASSDVSATVIAIAASNPSNSVSYSYDDEGRTQETNVAKIRVNLDRQGVNSGIVESDSALAKLGRSVVGKDIGEIRVVIGLIIFILVLLAEGSIIYGAVSSAITALGRNPLARKAIRSELIRVAVIAITVLFVGMGAVYAILWI